jgi:membrane protein DedA with SNARE-associated domain
MVDILSDFATWVLVWAVAVVLNAVPFFMPPTWSLLAYFHIQQNLPVWPLALTGAAAAVTGRAILALTSRRFGMRFLPKKRQESVETLTTFLRERKGLSLSMLGMFAIGPIPTNHLFIAAGLARIPLLPVLTVFGVTRFASYVLWVKAADTAARSLSEILTPSIGSAGAVAAQVAGFIVLILLLRIDWARLLKRWDKTPPTAAESTP